MSKFVEAKEIVKPGEYVQEHIGIELNRNKETVTLLCVSAGHWDDIDVQELELEKYKFKVTDKERVHHLFSVALKKSQIAAIEAETELLRARRDLKFHQDKIKQHFKKELTVGDLNDHRGQL